jgi:hypothetical protein
MAKDQKPPKSEDQPPPKELDDALRTILKAPPKKDKPKGG